MRPTLILIASIATLTTQTTAIASDSHALSKVAAIIADAVATNDTEVVAKHSMTYEDKAAAYATKIQNKTNFMKAQKERQKRTDSAWREFREANLPVDGVHIEEVIIHKIEGTKPDRYIVVARVLPVFTYKGETGPMPYLALRFIQVDGQWKYWN